MPKAYHDAESVQAIAQQLIPTFHPELAEARIRYYYVEEHSSKNGKPVYGKARKMSGAMEFLTDQDFVIEVALDLWNAMDEDTRRALIDHLLEYCTGEVDDDSGEMKYTTRQPDVNEFATILTRHGAWHDDLVGLVRIAQQIQIDEKLQEIENEINETHVTN